MKRLLLCSLVLGLPLAASAQGNANSFLARLPDPLPEICDPSGDDGSAYLATIAEVSRNIDAALAKRREEQEAHVRKNQARWKTQMTDQAIQQAGLTDAQAARVTSGRRLSKAEKAQLADEVLQQRTNISLAEARNLKNMTPEARKAWAQAYASEMMAVQQAKPPEERAADQKEQDRLMRLATLTKEQQDMLKRNNAVAEALRQKMLKLDGEAQEAYAQKVAPIDQRLAECRDEIAKASAAGQDEQAEALGAKARQIERERLEALKAHCAQFSPPYGELVRQYVTWAKGAQDGFIRYEEMENEKFKLQTKSPDNVLIVQTGMLGMQEADACVGLLKSVFKYRLYTKFDEVAAEMGAEP